MRHGAAAVEVVHEPGVVPREAGAALFATFGRRTARTGNMCPLARTMYLDVAKAPQSGHNTQAQG
ncbi:hypothetical protein J2T11_002233 [Paenarthrobacter nicotinovorans]|nr:hypothetical protein [Paenarthrobacter nicotinovorans]MDP9935878.1 hypothetical protein [Paenarthrobacter nicotinovorans]